MFVIFLDQALVHDVLVYQEITCTCVNTKLRALFEKHLSTLESSVGLHLSALNLVYVTDPSITVLDVIIMVLQKQAI